MPRRPARMLNVLLAAVFGAALAGFLVGTRPTQRIEPASGTDHLPGVTGHSSAPTAVSYRRMPEVNLGPNRNWSSDIRKLPRISDAQSPPAAAPSDDMRITAIAGRGAARAFEGAPPVIPHAIDQLTPANCMLCHGEGVRIADRVAPRMSHQHLTSCTQCHVPADAYGRHMDAGFPAISDENRFVPASSPVKGERAYDGAPPIIPHTTWMRNDCLSCHGPAGKEGLRTSHPDRLNCMQCHAPSAELDQRRPLDQPPPAGQPGDWSAMNQRLQTWIKATRSADAN